MLYDVPFLYFNDDLLAENTKIDTELTGEDAEMVSNALGFNGITPAPKVRRVTSTNMVPVTGMEKKFEAAYLNSEEVRLKIVLGGSGKSCSTKGYLKRVSLAGGTGAATEVTWEFVGTPSAFE